MARIFITDTDTPPESATEKLWVYNGLDSAVTLEVLDVLLPKLNEVTEQTYAFECDLQGPILEMMLRGTLIDKFGRDGVIRELEIKKAELEKDLSEILREGLGIPFFNPNSPAQCKALFYETFGLPVIRKRGTNEATTDRKALEKLSAHYHVSAVINHILAIRDCGKRLGTLRTAIDSDGRMRTSFNVAGTDTGRLSSYKSSFGSGTNLQNITEEIRRMFIADPGKRVAYIDLEQAESRSVGATMWNLFGDARYLDACESSDLHTMVAQLCWPGLPWSDDPKHNRALADQSFYRHFSFRDATKRLGHGTNYHGQAFQMSKETAIPLDLVTNFQKIYIAQFGLDVWHEHVRKQLLNRGFVTSLLGRRRWFFGRRWDNETLNAAIAYDPQSSVADYINRGIISLWKSPLCQSNTVQILLQVHDAILIQYPEELENEIIPQVQRHLEWEVPLLNGRSLIIPTEAKVGWNWGNAKNHKRELVNPDGLVKFDGNEKRTRTSILDRALC